MDWLEKTRRKTGDSFGKSIDGLVDLFRSKKKLK